MKKFNFTLFLVAIAFTLLIFSCNKNDRDDSANKPSENDPNLLKRNEATWITLPDQNNPKKWSINLKIYVGHTINQCGGKCVKIFWEYTHIDCRGFGNVCNYSFSSELSLDTQTGDYELVIINPEELGDFDEFQLPDRCLYITNPQNNTDLWLNIPEQILIQQPSKQPVIIHDIWFSEEPELENP